MTTQLDILTAENEELKRKLDLSARWMRRQIEEQMHVIAKKKTIGMSADIRREFVEANQEEIIAKRVHTYFGDILLMNAPTDAVKHITNAEMSYYLLQRSQSGDGFTVIGAYQKVIDAAIEQAITKDFRKYALKYHPSSFPGSDPLEKALNLVVNKRYLLSTGRLYALLRAARNHEKLPAFGALFVSWLERHADLSRSVLSDGFFLPFEALISSDFLAGKRHSGIMSLEETKLARRWIVGNFEDQNSVLYRLFESRSVLF